MLGKIFSGILICLMVLGTIGWVKSIVKLTRTDFNSPYKAEIIYGVGVFTGAGAIIGWININD
tara:strand:+ start:37 stop:225 length:189 start_codon:yes stop_codon:yes gene_type:complete